MLVYWKVRRAILSGVKIERMCRLYTCTAPYYVPMYKTSRPSAFSEMSRLEKKEAAGSYKAWKTPAQKETFNPASSSEFPDLVKQDTKKSAFEGVSLATKLKEAIAAEEEAAILKRLKKGDTPEMLLRESCAILPLKGSSRKDTVTLEVPEWVTDTSKPDIMRPFRHKSLADQAKERYFKRIGVNPKDVYLYDEEKEEDHDDQVSLPSVPESEPDMEEHEEPLEMR